MIEINGLAIQYFYSLNGDISPRLHSEGAKYLTLQIIFTIMIITIIAIFSPS